MLLLVVVPLVVPMLLPVVEVEVEVVPVDILLILINRSEHTQFQYLSLWVLVEHHQKHLEIITGQ
jgi:hypothetical protein